MRRSIRRRWMAVAVGSAVASLGVVGCADATTSTPPQPSGVSTLDGQTVKISGGLLGDDADALNDSFLAFEQETGIAVEYTGADEFDSTIVDNMARGAAPDIAVVTERAVLESIVATGDARPVTRDVTRAVTAGWGSVWRNYATVNDVFYAVPIRASIDGYVLYSPALFDDEDLAVPKTWDELLALTAVIQRTTDAPPWCVGFAADDADGKLGADWIADLVLRQAGSAVYDNWASGEISFTHPEIRAVFDELAKIIFNPASVNGDFGTVATINETTRQEAALAVADRACALSYTGPNLDAMLHAADGRDEAQPEFGPDRDLYAFILPSMTDDQTQVRVTGEFAVGLSGDAATQAVIAFMATAEFADARTKQSGAISAHRDADATLASSPLLRDAMDLLQADTTLVRFDAAEAMPLSVGAGSFWRGMTSWIDGTSTEAVLEDIEAGYVR